jgi:hypothetical protein
MWRLRWFAVVGEPAEFGEAAFAFPAGAAGAAACRQLGDVEVDRGLEFAVDDDFQLVADADVAGFVADGGWAGFHPFAMFVGVVLGVDARTQPSSFRRMARCSSGAIWPRVTALS